MDGGVQMPVSRVRCSHGPGPSPAAPGIPSRPRPSPAVPSHPQPSVPSHPQPSPADPPCVVISTHPTHVSRTA
eukprot:4846117-Prymnesium_polylepis.1